MSTQKELDLEVADRIEDLVSTLAQGYGISKSVLSTTEYLNLTSALRYAISTLRSMKYD